MWLTTEYSKNYLISSYGNVFSIKNNRILKQKLDNNGYYSIILSDKGKQKRLRVHRLVASAFVKNKNRHNEVNHIDGKKTNNKSYNLEWVTRAYNVQHSYDNKLRLPAPSFGEKHGMSKLNKKDILSIRKLYKTGEYSYNDIAVMFNMNKSTIGRIIRNIYWKNI